jgi:PAS domain S-box-containing protein
MEVTKFRSQVIVALEQATIRLQHARNTLAGLVRSAVRASESELRKWLASSFDAVVVTNDKITRQLSVAFEQLTVHLHRGQNAVTGLLRTAVARPRRLREAARTRESDLRRLLANSFDAVVVMNGDRRFVAANPAALYLFGVSEANISKFTIDAFFPHGQIRCFDAKDSPFIGREERVGKCKIRRLDGSIRVAEYVFVANFVPFQHLCRFVSIASARFLSGQGPSAVRSSRVQPPCFL